MRVVSESAANQALHSDRAAVLFRATQRVAAAPAAELLPTPQESRRMAIRIYLGFNPPIPEVQLHSDGKLLGTHLEQLHRLAEIAGVPPLGSFMDQRVPEPDSDYDMLDFDEFIASRDEWFPAS